MEKIIYHSDERLGRFIVFAYDQYYPGGGLGDAVYDSGSLEDALNAAEKFDAKYDNVELCDSQNGMVEIDVEQTRLINTKPLEYAERLILKQTLYRIWFKRGGLRLGRAEGPVQAAILAQAEAIKEGLDFSIFDMRDEETGQVYVVSKVEAKRK